MSVMSDVFEGEPLHPGRKSIRVQGYDYSSPGLYFLTVCTHDKRWTLGTVDVKRVVLSNVGHIVRECWIEIPEHFAVVQLHGFVIMPNHLHGIVQICAKLGRSSAASLRGIGVTAGSLGAIVRSFKAAVTKRVRLELGWKAPVWQRNYFERVLRDGQEFADATRYIAENALKWELDRENQNRRREQD